MTGISVLEKKKPCGALATVIMYAIQKREKKKTKVWTRKWLLRRKALGSPRSKFFYKSIFVRKLQKMLKDGCGQFRIFIRKDSATNNEDGHKCEARHIRWGTTTSWEPPYL
ncbi:hypothetical protein AVEN_234877-1 [Araneus ventricosus]|uniref:Uncharacterized protein n=1 Tax=Araneus ventricosus TaxID=182803 RepID=A0A4Y2MJB1_ARAVE|nr:hypothetical protein AVEN_234877-1 [Araneus ventricosus]